MSPTTAGQPLAARLVLPRWLTPVVAVGLSLTFVLTVDAVAVRVPIQVLVALLACLAVGHGLAHRHWRTAGPLAVLALVGIVVAAAAGDSVQLDIGPEPGQSGLDGWIRLIWVVAALTLAGVTTLAVSLQRRSTRPAALVADLHAQELRHADGRDHIRESLASLDTHLTAIERLLQEVE